MKKSLLLSIAILSTLVVFAQDIIIGDPADSTVVAAKRRGNYSGHNNHTDDDRFNKTYCNYCHKAVYLSDEECDRPISSYFFNKALLKVKAQSTIAGRKLAAKKLASNHCLTASQVYELVDAMMFTSAKMEVAKFCYTRCIDRENFEVVFQTFTTSSAVEELNEYITNYTCSGHHNNNNGYNQNSCKKPMATSDFAIAMKTIKDANFDNTRLETAKTIATTNCLTTDQVMEICKLLSFESSKLEFAEFAYSHTYDQSNYFKVSNVFNFSSTKTSLNKFLQNAGK